jgi:peptidyl-prolyl cis-trans isomerase SurA
MNAMNHFTSTATPSAALSKSLMAAAILAATSFVSSNAVAQARPVLVDRIVAIVNDEVITQHELNIQKRAVIGQLKRQGVAAPGASELDAQVLERFINERVQLQHARENGIRVDDETVTAALQNIAKQNKMSMIQFSDALKADGVSVTQFREELKNEIIINRIREREIESRIVVTDGEIDGYLTNAKLQGAQSQAEYQLAHILVLVPEQATPDQIDAKKKRAEEAAKQLKAGTAFAQVAAVFSDTNDAAQGGALGWRQADRLPAFYAEAAQKLAIGANSDVMRSANGFHIVRLLDKKTGETQKAVVQQNRARHILVRVNELVGEAEAKAKIERLQERITSGAKFEDVAKLNSEDTSASKGGDLGWMSPGETVAEFEAAMDKAEIKTVVGPVRTQFGFHLIEVVERRSQDVTTDRTRQAARTALRERKSDEAYQSWLRETRDRATIDIKLSES